MCALIVTWALHRANTTNMYSKIYFSNGGYLKRKKERETKKETKKDTHKRSHCFNIRAKDVQNPLSPVKNGRKAEKLSTLS